MVPWGGEAGGGGRCFFFQAEDGIRDLTVTGVQTCALPICRRAVPRQADGRAARPDRRHDHGPPAQTPTVPVADRAPQAPDSGRRVEWAGRAGPGRRGGGDFSPPPPPPGAPRGTPPPPKPPPPPACAKKKPGRDPAPTNKTPTPP